MLVAADSTLWLDGRLKTLAGMAAGDIRLDVYGLGDASASADDAVRYTLRIKAAGGAMDWKLAAGSPWSVGIRLIHAEVEPRLRDAPRFADLDDRRARPDRTTTPRGRAMRCSPCPASATPR